MDVLEAIRGRRSVARFRPDPVPAEALAPLLDAVRWAPNHHHTRPWHVTVIQGQARERLAAFLAERALAQEPAPTPDAVAARHERERRKAHESPVILAIACLPVAHPRALPEEDLLAVGAAVQNLLLAAHATGLAAHWRTSSACRDGSLATWLQLPAGSRVVALVSLGFPDGEPPLRPDPPGPETYVRILPG